MPKVKGDVVGDYTIVKELHFGACATCYEAISADGQHVFLKEYKDPTPMRTWYCDYIDYERQKKEIIDASEARDLCINAIDQFEDKRYYQVYELITAGSDLRCELDKMKDEPVSLTWERRKTHCLVLGAALSRIHAAGIVHGDLKPENVQLIEDKTIGAGHQTKLIDMDMSLLSGKMPPWIEDLGYVGTPNYWSPEHIRRELPNESSDVFTYALIVCELLCGRNPLAADDVDVYRDRVLSDEPRNIELLHPVRDAEVTRSLENLLGNSLSPRAVDRPSLESIRRLVSGKLSSSPSTSPTSPPSADSVERTRVGLQTTSGGLLSIGVDQWVGSGLLRQYEPSASWVDRRQFYVFFRDGWFVRHNVEATNATLLNGVPVTEERPLGQGDEIAIGNLDGSVRKSVMTVRVEHT